METLNKYAFRLKSFSRKPYFWLAVLVFSSLVLHFATIGQPAEYVFDEKWYVADAAHILDGRGSAIPQHPPLGTLIIAGGMGIFGDNPLGWRFFPVVFGTAAVVLIYLICRQLKLGSRTAFTAAFLLALSNLAFVQSSVAMLDVFSVTFMLAAFYVYLKGRYLGTGLLLALSMLSKFTGIFGLAVIGIHWLITSRRNWFKFGLMVGLIPTVYLGMLVVCDLVIWGKLINPVTETVTMLQINSWSTFADINSTMLSRPWEWLFNYEIITYWPDPHYMAMLSPTIWLAAIPSMVYMGFKTWKSDKGAAFALSWFAGAYLLWIPISLITDRTSYIFYFYPAIGAVCLAVAIGLNDLAAVSRRSGSKISAVVSTWLIPVYLFVHLAFFVYFSPTPYGWKLATGALLYMGVRMVFGSKQQEQRYVDEANTAEQKQPAI